MPPQNIGWFVLMIQNPLFLTSMMLSLSIILPPSQNDCPYSHISLSEIEYPTRNWGSKLNVFSPSLLSREVFWHHNFQGCFGVVFFFYVKICTYNYLVKGQMALILPKLETRTIILGQRESYCSDVMGKRVHDSPCGGSISKALVLLTMSPNRKDNISILHHP